MNVSKSRILRIVLLVLLIFVTLSWILTALFLSLSFGRRDGGGDKEKEYEARLSALCDSREISFLSDGNLLHGSLYDLKDDKGLVVMVHGIGGGADSFLRESLSFCLAGYDVLAYDGTGSRSSQGTGIRGLSQAFVDLDAALELVENDPVMQKQPLVVFGHSAGGYAAAVAAKDHPEIDCVICLNAFDTPMKEMLEKGRERAGNAAYLGYPVLALQYWILFGSDGFLSASEALSDSGVPALVAAGSEDTVVPYRASLYAGKEQIDDSDAVFLMVSEPGRNGHSDIMDEAFMQEIITFTDQAVSRAEPLDKSSDR